MSKFPLIESYITTETLMNNCLLTVSGHGYLVGLNHEVLKTKNILITYDWYLGEKQCIDMQIEITEKFAPYFSKTFAKYNVKQMKIFRTTSFIFYEDDKNAYDILLNLKNLLDKVKEKYDRANRDVEQIHRK